MSSKVFYDKARQNQIIADPCDVFGPFTAFTVPDRWGNTTPHFEFVVDEETAEWMQKDGFHVRKNEYNDEVSYYVKANVRYRKRTGDPVATQPKVVRVTVDAEGHPIHHVELDEHSVSQLDHDIILKARLVGRYYQIHNSFTNEDQNSIDARVLYVYVQETDPFAEDLADLGDGTDAEVPF